MRAVVGLQILILQLLLHFCFSSLHMSQFRDSGFISVQILQRMDISTLLPDPKGQRIMVVVYITMTLQYFSSVTCPNILVDVVSSDHAVYSNNDLTSDLTSHAIARDDFTRSCTSLGNRLLRRYYCWAEKLMLHRNWALQTLYSIDPFSERSLICQIQ